MAFSSLLPHFNETAPERGKKSFVGVVDGAEIEESSSLPDIESGDQWVSFLPFLRDEAWDSQIRSTSLSFIPAPSAANLDFRSRHLIPAASSRHFYSLLWKVRGEKIPNFSSSYLPSSAVKTLMIYSLI